MRLSTLMVVTVFCFLTVPAFAQGIWVGHGPVSCLVPVDSMTTNECQNTLVKNGNSAHCKMSVVKDGKDYIAIVRVGGTRLATKIYLPPLQPGKIKVKGEVVRCTISPETVVGGKCTSWGNDYSGGGHCVYCTKDNCYRGNGTVRLTPKSLHGNEMAAEQKKSGVGHAVVKKFKKKKPRRKIGAHYLEKPRN